MTRGTLDKALHEVELLVRRAAERAVGRWPPVEIARGALEAADTAVCVVTVDAARRPLERR